MSPGCQTNRSFLLICIANMAFTLQLTRLQPATYPITGCPLSQHCLLRLHSCKLPARFPLCCMAERSGSAWMLWNCTQLGTQTCLETHLVTQCEWKHQHTLCSPLYFPLLDACWRMHFEPQNYGNVITIIQSKLNCVLIHFQITLSIKLN